MATCPCCGAESTAQIPPSALAAYIHVTPVQRRVLNVLVRHFGKEVPSETIIDAAYFDREDGGPKDGRNSITVIIHRLRKRLLPYGYTIRGFWGSARLQQVSL